MQRNWFVHTTISNYNILFFLCWRIWANVYWISMNLWTYRFSVTPETNKIDYMTNLKTQNCRNNIWKSEKLEQHFCSASTKYKCRNQVSTLNISTLEIAFWLTYKMVATHHIIFLQIIFRNEVAPRMVWEWRDAWLVAQQPLNSFVTIRYRAYTISSQCNWTTHGGAEDFLHGSRSCFSNQAFGRNLPEEAYLRIARRAGEDGRGTGKIMGWRINMSKYNDTCTK